MNNYQTAEFNVVCTCNLQFIICAEQTKRNASQCQCFYFIYYNDLFIPDKTVLVINFKSSLYIKYTPYDKEITITQLSLNPKTIQYYYDNPILNLNDVVPNFQKLINIL